MEKKGRERKGKEGNEIVRKKRTRREKKGREGKGKGRMEVRNRGKGRIGNLIQS